VFPLERYEVEITSNKKMS